MKTISSASAAALALAALSLTTPAQAEGGDSNTDWLTQPTNGPALEAGKLQRSRKYPGYWQTKPDHWGQVTYTYLYCMPIDGKDFLLPNLDKTWVEDSEGHRLAKVIKSIVGQDIGGLLSEAGVKLPDTGISFPIFDKIQGIMNGPDRSAKIEIGGYRPYAGGCPADVPRNDGSSTPAPATAAATARTAQPAQSDEIDIDLSAPAAAVPAINSNITSSYAARPATVPQTGYYQQRSPARPQQPAPSAQSGEMVIDLN